MPGRPTCGAWISRGTGASARRNDYHTNMELYPKWQAYLREHQPSTLVVWGQGDPVFLPAGANAYLRDLPQAKLHLLDTSHFALEEDASVIAEHIRAFLGGKSD